MLIAHLPAGYMLGHVSRAKGAVLTTGSASHSHWMLSFMVHWSFLVELLICATAPVLYLRKRNE